MSKLKSTNVGIASWMKKLRLAIILLTVLVAAYGVLSFLTDRLERQRMAQFSVAKYIEQTPKFVFKTINFYKYVAYGKPDGTNLYLDKLDVFHITGSADLYIDMQYLTMDSAKTDYISKELYLVFNSPTKLPIGIDVSVAGDKFVNVETILPKRVSESEAQKAAKSVSEVTKDLGTFLGGAVGLYGGVKIGGSVGNAAGNALSNPILKFASGIAGSIFGGGIGALAGGYFGGKTGEKYGFLITKNLLTGFHLTTGHGAGEKEQILMNAKSLIAVELAGGDMFNEPDFDSKLQQYYQKECNKAIETAMKNFGWKTVNVEFKY